MTEIEIGENEANQRLDRFLRKYLKGASLSYIYKLIRKDIKVNGARAKNDTLLQRGDRIFLYLKPEELERFHPERTISRSKAKRTFSIAYEDDNILAAEKPFGLLTHGDGKEKKNTLVNQVTDYLIEKGEYIPRMEKSFAPAAVNRLDRNTTGLVLFGKNSASLRALNEMIRDKNAIGKYYLTIVRGRLEENLFLSGNLTKDEKSNRVKISRLERTSVSSSDFRSGGPSFSQSEDPLFSHRDEEAGADTARSGETASSKDQGKSVETLVHPLHFSDAYTLAEIRLMTGRTHQIRAHMAAAGYPIIGDAKYGDPSLNRLAEAEYGLTSQFLHAYRLEIFRGEGILSYLSGRSIVAGFSQKQSAAVRKIFGRIELPEIFGEQSDRNVKGIK